MHAHEAQSVGYQPQAGSAKNSPFATRPFEVTYPGQEVASSSTNPFPQRAHETWNIQSATPASTHTTIEQQPETEAAGSSELDWNRIHLYAQGQPPPEPPWWRQTQAKLTIGQRNDPYEQEADRVAAQVMAMPEPASSVQCQVDESEQEIQPKPLSTTITPLVQRQIDVTPPKADEEIGEKTTNIQAKSGSSTELSANSTLEQQLTQQQGQGSPLPTEVRSFMEPRFGADFSQVRVHTGSEAVQMNQEVGAKAFTHKQDIYFNSGYYSPNSDGGRELLAHELTHTIQQTGGLQLKNKEVNQSKPQEINQNRLAPKALQPLILQNKISHQPPHLQQKCEACEAEEKVQPLIENKIVSFERKPVFDGEISPKVQLACETCTTGENIQRKTLVENKISYAESKGIVQADIVPDFVKSGANWVGDKASTGAQWVGDKAGQAVAWGQEQFASLVARVAPGLSSLIQQGPIGLLTDKIKEGIKGWLSGVVSGANIGNVVATLQGSFAQVFAGVQALGKGDPASCAAFAESIQKLRDLGQAFMNNPVVKQIQAAFAKVRSVFEKVTSAIIAPVFDTLMSVAGGVFDAVKGLATTIWEWGAPVRNTLGAAWEWVKQQLGIGGDGSSGVLGWLKTKASEAWTSIKTTFAPVIEPLKKVGMVLLAFSPMGLFAAIVKVVPKLVQIGEWLWAHKGDKDIVKKAHQEMGNTILPQLLGAVQSFSQVIQSTVTSLVSQVTELSQSVLSLLGAISGVPLLSMGRSLVQDLSEKLQSLVGWGQDAFQSVAKSVQEAFTKIVAKIKPYAGILSSLALAIANPGMIPVILAGTAWQLLDDCYKPPIIDFLLDAVIGILQAAPSLPMFGLLWPMLKTGVIGFLQGVKAQPAATKVVVTNKLAKIISGGSPAFLLGFAKGLLKGLWEGLTDPFVLIYEGLKGLSNLVVWLNDTASQALAPEPAMQPVAATSAAGSPSPAATGATSNQPRNAPMGQRMQQMAGELQPPADQVAQGFMPAMQAAFSGGEGLTFEQLMQKLGDAWSAVENAIREAGGTLASKVCEFMMQDGAEGEMGETAGWLAGTIAFEVALAVLTGGADKAVKGAMKVLQTFARILDWTGEALGLAFKALAKVGGFVLKAVKGLGKLLSKAGGAAKVLLDALSTIGRKLMAFADELLGLLKKAGKGAAGEVAEEAAEKSAKEAAETAAEKGTKEAVEAGAEKGAKETAEAGAEKTTKEASDDYARGISKNDPSTHAEITSTDGMQFNMDFRRDLSGAAQGLVRKLEQQGFVRVDSIHPDDLVSISKWFGKEIGVLQSPYHNGLRLVLGTETGVLKKQIRPGEVFVVHTHPVFRSQKSHFGVDIPNAGKHTEAVIDWSGQIIYFNKKGVLNPVTPSGFTESMPASFQSAFMDAEGRIIGYSKVEVLVESSGKTKVKVVE